ncbi:hypothetical protein EZ449_15365 [Pedobacter frigidisoli]|uniref:Uncharacterized protein n=2 Tax=Pedobacter frigidisoli TaxID=2530455 RepID=A0A4R0NVY7_9SPHI|nr:hypothetical protein EZ449_15365 [Pedobacter frigidisoli]
MLAAHYRSGYLKELRMGRILRNLESGIEMQLLEKPGNGYGNHSIDLYGDGADSITISRSHWGIYDLAQVWSFVSTDSIAKSMLIGLDNHQDSTAIYLSDEDRPLSVSGDTRIKGVAFVPKSGIRKAYVESRPYSGVEVVYGKINDSGRKLDGLTDAYLGYLKEELKRAGNIDGELQILPTNSLTVGFLDSVQRFRVPKGQVISQQLSGKMILYADSMVVIEKYAKLDNIIVFAQSIKVEEGFIGNCQLFARDSITVGNNASLSYPSVLGIISVDHLVDQAKIDIGKNVKFEGIILSYEDKRSALQTMISIGSSSIITGEVYATGLLKLSKDVKVFGKVSCNRFIMKTPTTLYENFLVDVTLDRKSRSKYYLGSPIFRGKEQHGKILKWLN